MKKQTITIRDEAIRKGVLSMISGLDPDKVWVVTVAQYRKPRTLSQNALVHKWFAEIADFNGDSASSVKVAMKDEFSPRVESKTIPGKMIPKGISEMEAPELSEFMDRVSALAHSFGAYLTHPEDMHDRSAA